MKTTSHRDETKIDQIFPSSGTSFQSRMRGKTDESGEKNIAIRNATDTFSLSLSLYFEDYALKIRGGYRREETAYSRMLPIVSGSTVETGS